MNPLVMQVGGDHYKNMEIQPVEFAMENKLDYCTSNIIKYVCRFREKNGREDLNKARQYIDMLEYFEYGDTV